MAQDKTGEFRVGLVQMCTGRSVEKNLADAAALIREAARQGAQYVQTPEITTLMETERERLFATVRPEEGNAAISYFCALARELGIWLHVGSMGILLGTGRIANRSFLISPDRPDRGALRQDPHVRRAAAGRRELPRIQELSIRRSRSCWPSCPGARWA